jgi:hypothetical protein
MGFPVRPTGFDCYTTPTFYFNSTSASSGSISIGAYGRNSTSGLRLSGNNSGVVTLRARKTIGSIGTLYTAFSFKLGAIPITVSPVRFLELYDAGTLQLYFEILTNGTIRVYRGNGTVLGTTTFSVIVNTIYHFEVKSIIDNSTGSVSIRINESALTAFTGLDTQNTANATVDEVVLCNNSDGGGFGVTVNLDFDDFIPVRDDDWNGDCQVREDLPTGTGDVDDGVATGAADSRQATDEADPDDDTTYTALQNVNDKVLLTYPNIPTTSEVIALFPTMYAKKSAAGTASFKPLLKISSTEYLGTELFPSDGSYAYLSDVMTVSPATSNPFTPSEINGMQYGLKRIS